MPPLPGWDGLHPLVIHFPVALLLTVPVLLILALIIPRHMQGLMIAAFALMFLGTVAAMVSISTGQAAAELAERTPTVNAVLEHHEEMAEQVRTVFITLTVIFAALLFVPLAIRKPLGRALRVSSLAVMLVLALAGDLMIANAAHQGARLVHQYGIHAIMASSGGSTGAADAIGTETDD